MHPAPDRFITDDGTIWPRARGEMTHAADIAARMAQDILAIQIAAGRVSADYLRLKGWQSRQIDLHLPAALDAAARLKARAERLHAFSNV